MGELINIEEWKRNKAAGKVKEPTTEEGSCPLCAAPATFYPNIEDPDDVIFNPEKVLEGMKKMQKGQHRAIEELLKNGEELDTMLERVDMTELLLDIRRYREVLLNLIEEFGMLDDTPVRKEIFEEAEALLDEYDTKF